MKMATDKLLEEFAPVSTEAWEEAIRKDLKGADYQKKLVWQTAEGLAVKPYYRKEDIAGLDCFRRSDSCSSVTPGMRLNGDWRIREEIDAINPEEANQAAQRAVAAGAEQIAFLNANVQNGSDLGLLLVNLQEIPVHFQNAGETLLRLLIAREKGRPDSAQFSSGWSPLESPAFAAEILLASPRGFVPFTIDGSGFEESGATVVQEIGYTLAAAIDFLADMALARYRCRSSGRRNRIFICNWLELLFPNCEVPRIPQYCGRRRKEASAEKTKCSGANPRAHVALEQDHLRSAREHSSRNH